MSIENYGVWASPCGYCGSDDNNFVTEAFDIDRIPHGKYQELIDHGWRRSGNHFYRPVHQMICCKPYTIRLDVHQFQLRRSQRKLIKKFAKQFTNQTLSDDCVDWLERLVNSDDSSLRFTLEPATVDTEAFRLYQDYQVNRHGDSLDELTIERYKRFLVDSPIVQTGPYGTFHHKWYWNDELIAVGVLDILEHCVSSVYFFYKMELSQWSLGTCSALIEITLTKHLSRTSLNIHYYYMGYYIDDCSKMRYKADFEPSMILDPESNTWITMEEAKETLFHVA